jgi:hypothetical protein
MVVVLFRLPDVPVTVIVDEPGAAVALAVRVSVLAPVVLTGLKAAVTPVGKPDAANATAPVKPFCAPTAMLLVALADCGTLTLFGVAVNVNDGGVVIVSATFAVLVNVPEVPVMVMLAAPSAAVALAVNVKVLVVTADTEVNDAVTPDGSPDTARFTVPEKLFCGLIVMVTAPFDP